MDVRETVDEILNSPQLRQSLESTVRNITQSRPRTGLFGNASGPVSSTPIQQPSTSGHTSVRQELNRLFPSIGSRGSPRLSTSRSRTRSGSSLVNTKTFNRDVILLAFKDSYKTLKGVHKAAAYENGNLKYLN